MSGHGRGHRAPGGAQSGLRGAGPVMNLWSSRGSSPPPICPTSPMHTASQEEEAPFSDPRHRTSEHRHRRLPRAPAQAEEPHTGRGGTLLPPPAAGSLHRTLPQASPCPRLTAQARSPVRALATSPTDPKTHRPRRPREQ